MDANGNGAYFPDFRCNLNLIERREFELIPMISHISLFDFPILLRMTYKALWCVYLPYCFSADS